MHKEKIKYNKWKKRIGIVVGNSARNIIPQVLNSLLSLLVIKYSSFAEWGNLVKYLLIFNLCSQFVAWGSKQYLLREFAASPSKIKLQWFENTYARSILLLFSSVVIVFIPITLNVKQILILCLIINYLSRSYDVLIIYFKKINFFLLIEIILSLIFLSIIFLNKSTVDTILILYSFLFIESIRLIISAIYFRGILDCNKEWRIDYKLLISGSLIFTLGIIGMIQTRLDLYFVAILLPKKDIAVYQVMINFIILVQAATGFIIQPFIKTIYRLRNKSLMHISIRFSLLGIILAFPIALLIQIVLAVFYRTVINWQILILIYLYIIPIFYYTIRIYLLYKQKREAVILVTGIIVLLLSLPLNYYLIQLYRIRGALFAGVTGELLSLLFYSILEKRSRLVHLSRYTKPKLKFNEI